MVNCNLKIPNRQVIDNYYNQLENSIKNKLIQLKNFKMNLHIYYEYSFLYQLINQLII